MPINAYTGLMGSGKSYECVLSVIVPAIKNGRRVVTNVDGIDSDAIRAYCQEKWDADPDKLGCVVHCTNDDVSKASFLPYGENVDTFCKPGDIICIDEAWRFWGTDCKLLSEHKIFFREHRHFVDPESKVSCDLVLMVQDIGDLHRTLKVVVELTFKTTKIKTLGWDKTYRVEMWEGYKLTQKGRVSVENKRYDPAVFPLYSSYQGGAGKEMRVDDRQNILKSPRLWILAVVVMVMFGLGVWGLSASFQARSSKTKKRVMQRHRLRPWRLLIFSNPRSSKMCPTSGASSAPTKLVLIPWWSLQMSQALFAWSIPRRFKTPAKLWLGMWTASASCFGRAFLSNN